MLSITDVKLFHETVMSFRKVDHDELMQGSLRQIFNAKNDHDVLSWFVSVLQPDNASSKQLRDELRKKLFDMGPRIHRALEAKMLNGEEVGLGKELDGIWRNYLELERALVDLTIAIDPKYLPVVKQVYL